MGGVSDEQVAASGGIQLVHYREGDFYRPHFDSLPLEHLHTVAQGHGHHHFPARPRAATLLYVLQGQESGLEGGQLAFPLHRQPATLTHRNFFGTLQISPDEWARKCKDGLVLPVERGSAMLWYNHEIVDGLVADVDVKSFHGGCEVLRGDKWIANQWLELWPPYANPE